MDGVGPEHIDAHLAAMRLTLSRTYVRRPEDDRFRRHVRERLAERAAFMRGETAPDAKRESQPILLTGPSGAGKSRMSARAFADDPRLPERRGERDLPLVSVRVLGTSTLKAAGLKVLSKLGYSMHPRATDHAIWHEVHHRLKLAETHLLHLDEFQAVSDHAHEDEKAPIRDTVKSLVISEKHPVVVVLTGQESLASFFHDDPQLRRRSWSTVLPRLTSDDWEDVWRGVESVAQKGGVRVDDDLREVLVPRLLHAADGQLGAAMEIAVEATLHALAPIGEDGCRRPCEGEPALTMRDFAAHYADKTQNAPFANVFLARDWQLLDPMRTGILNPAQLKTPPEVPKRETGSKRRPRG